MQDSFQSNRRKLLLGAMGGAAGLWLGMGSNFAMANSHPVRFILPLSVGSGVDTIARSASQALSEALNGRSVVVDNQPGAGGVIGTQAIVRATPDGNTLGFVSNNHVIFPNVVKDLGFDPVEDITPISIVCTSPLLVMVRPGLPVENLKDLEKLLKENPDQYNFGSSGNGTILHLAAEQFLKSSGAKSMHIPYRGTGPLVTAVLAGQVDWAVIALPAIAGLLEAGSLKAVATATRERLESVPDLPTGVEQGYPDYVVEGWVGAVGPKGLSEETVNTMYEALKVAYTRPSVQEAMKKQGNIVTLRPPAEAREYFASERKKYADLSKAAGLVPQ